MDRDLRSGPLGSPGAGGGPRDVDPGEPGNGRLVPVSLRAYPGRLLPGVTGGISVRDLDPVPGVCLSEPIAFRHHVHPLPARGPGPRGAPQDHGSHGARGRGARDGICRPARIGRARHSVEPRRPGERRLPMPRRGRIGPRRRSQVHQIGRPPMIPLEENFMHRFHRSQVTALALLWMIFAPTAALAAAGEAGFAFLKLRVGARPMGMGSAYVALATDPTAVYWNPAGLADAEGAQVVLMHNEWIQDFRQEFAAVSGSLGPGRFGLGLAGFYTSELEERDDVGTLTRHFGFNDLAVTGAYAYRFAPQAAGGVAVKFIREMIDQENATAVAFDLGGRLGIGKTGAALGAAVQNLGGKAKFESE